MGRNRYDETWHRLREWTKGQTPSERLAAQILLSEGFSDFDPSHPLGGQDGGKDAIAKKGSLRYAMAAYFPRGQQTFQAIKDKFAYDLVGAKRNSIDGVAFVTNQELTLSQRAKLASMAAPTPVELYHLERITTILDRPGMAQVREQFLEILSDAPSPINLGGQGGSAPGAGGGGGGAIGPDATGGSGGPGGDINLNGNPGEAPGAGGGGVGAIGKGAVGGEGGGGGEHVSVTLGPSEIGPETGFHHIEFRVGKGGVGGPGEDTILNLCDENGHVLRSIVAKGGRQGRPPYVPPPSRTPTEQDVKAGLKVSGILAAEFIRFNKDGLVTVVDGGWDFFQVGTNPFRIFLPLLVEVETGTIEAHAVLDLRLLVRSPDGFQVREQVQTVTVAEGLARRSRFAVVLELSGSLPGLWKVQVLAGSQLIGEFPIEIRLTAAEQTAPALASDGQG